MIQRDASRHIAIALALAGLLIGRPGNVQTQGETESYDSLVRLYRAGNVRRATTGVGARLGNGYRLSTARPGA